MQQIPLPVELRPEADFATYHPGPNTEALAAVCAWAAGDADPFLLLFGPSGTGKTHLLQAACRAAADRGVRAVYLPLSHPDLAVSALEDLERAPLVALDDVQAVAGDTAWERGLFDLYNRLRETGSRLLASAGVPSAELPIELPDLRSRLGWGPAYRLRPLDEADCGRLLEDAARRRGLDLGRDTVAYIMRRCPREPRPLLRLLAELDRVSLRDKRRPTRPLIRAILDASADGG